MKAMGMWILALSLFASANCAAASLSRSQAIAIVVKALGPHFFNPTCYPLDASVRAKPRQFAFALINCRSNPDLEAHAILRNVRGTWRFLCYKQDDVWDIYRAEKRCGLTYREASLLGFSAGGRATPL